MLRERGPPSPQRAARAVRVPIHPALGGGTAPKPLDHVRSTPNLLLHANCREVARSKVDQLIIPKLTYVSAPYEGTCLRIPARYGGEGRDHEAPGISALYMGSRRKKRLFRISGHPNGAGLCADPSGSML
eukprot:6651005-Prymnesium_polylepis.1